MVKNCCLDDALSELVKKCNLHPLQDIIKFMGHNTDFIAESAHFYPSQKGVVGFHNITDKGNPICLVLQGSPQ